MFCDGCGAVLPADQRFCSRCRKEVRGTTAIGSPRPGRVQEHLRLLAILWLALSAVNLIGGVVLVILANTLFVHLPEMGGASAASEFLRPLLTVVGIFVLAKAGLGFVAGWGLLERQTWARILCLVLGFISLFNIPLGTALGIYTLWVLLPADSEREYQAHAQAA